MLVWVASYPRSGNALTMLALQDIFGEPRIGTVTAGELRGGELLDAIRERPEPFFIKTHRLSEAADPAPGLYIVRDGRDAIVSQAHFVKDRGVAAYRGLSFERLDVPLGEARGEMLPFESLHGLVPTLFRRGIVGAWKDEMPPRLEERF